MIEPLQELAIRMVIGMTTLVIGLGIIFMMIHLWEQRKAEKDRQK